MGEGARTLFQFPLSLDPPSADGDAGDEGPGIDVDPSVVDVLDIDVGLDVGVTSEVGVGAGVGVEVAYACSSFSGDGWVSLVGGNGGYSTL